MTEARPQPDFHVVTFPSMRELRRRLPRLLIGVVVLSFGIALTLNARLGVSPYDVLHQGLAEVTGWSFGTVVVVLGLVILVAWIPIGQRLGIGTIVNTLTVGFITDGFLHVLPEPDALLARWPMLLGGIVVAAFGMACYIGAGLGPGPRDGVMTGLAARGLSIRAARTGIEITVLVIGWVLGGTVGVGTVVYALGIGPLAHIFIPLLRISDRRKGTLIPSTVNASSP